MRPGTPQFIGERLREAREARCLTQITLSEMLGVSNRAVSQYEKGTASPHPDIMAKIPKILNFPPQFFFTPCIKAQQFPLSLQAQ
jgi:transcriptional regulator with XRE-family HTH domain